MLSGENNILENDGFGNTLLILIALCAIVFVWCVFLELEVKDDKRDLTKVNELLLTEEDPEIKKQLEERKIELEEKLKDRVLRDAMD